MSSNGWKKEPLRSLCSLITDGKHGDCTPQDNSGYYFLSAKDVADGKLSYENARQITKEDFDEAQRRTQLEPLDILLTNSGTIGRMAIAKDTNLTSKTTFQKSVALLKPVKQKIDPFFLYYCLLSRKNDIVNTACGTTQQNLLLGDLRTFEIEIPKQIETQHHIADILSALDDKIELNRQTNATLEAIAQAIFKEWFVDFNFPGATGEMIESELGPIPKGWIIGKVAEICKANINVITENDHYNWINYVEIGEVKRGNIENTTYYKFGTEPSRAKRKLCYGDTVLSTVRPNRGSYFLSLDLPKNLIVSTGFAVFSPTEVPYSFLYLLLTDPEKIVYYGHVADGAAYPSINPKLIMNIDLVIPEKRVVDYFHTIAEPILNMMIHNEKESKYLAQLRDTLLPKLMSGEIEV